VAGDYGYILKTTDGGVSWNSQNSGTNQDITSIFFVDNQTGWVVGESGTIIKTTNGGENWFNQTSAVNHHLSSVYFTDNQTGWVVGYSGSVMKTTNGGLNWVLQRSGTTNYLYDVSFADANNGWAVGNNGTILHTTNGGVTFIEEENSFTQPKEFLLQQNYPNPFNPSTIIQYTISSIQFVTLKVYDLLGREVATLVDEYRNAGSYEVEFPTVETGHAPSLPSGVYFYRLQTGNFVETKKMILLK
jgi:hypothetical protein